MGYFDNAAAAEDTPPKQTEFVLAPPGKYEFKVDEVVVRSKANENAYSTGSEGLELRLLVGTDKGDQQSRVYLVDTPKAAFKVKEFCSSVGIPLASASPDTLANKTGIGEFDHREHNGKTYFNAKEFYKKEDDVPF